MVHLSQCKMCSLSLPLNFITGHGCSIFLGFSVIKYGYTYCLLIDLSFAITIGVCPTLLPGGLGVILKPVIHELVLCILHTEGAVMFTSLQLFVDGPSTSDGNTGAPFSPTFSFHKLRPFTRWCHDVSPANFHLIDEAVVMIHALTCMLFM